MRAKVWGSIKSVVLIIAIVFVGFHVYPTSSADTASRGSAAAAEPTSAVSPQGTASATSTTTSVPATTTTTTTVPVKPVAPAATGTPTVSSGGVIPPATSFTAYVGAGAPLQLKALSTQLGYNITYASDAMGQSTWTDISDYAWDINSWKGSGYHMIWAVPMLPDTGGVSLAIGATGAYNGYFTLLAQNLVAAGMGNSYLRIGWEFNQSRYPWYAAGQADAFVTYWRQIVTAMRAVPGTQFHFIWNPSRGDNGPKDKAMGNLASYYPGDAYVDMIGMDVYDTAWNSYPARVQSSSGR